MLIEQVTSEEYTRALGGHESHIYNTVGFVLLNAHKCERVHYLLLRDSKVRLGLILGERAGRLLSPFSAPFGGMTARGNCAIGMYRDAVAALKGYAGGRPVQITLPPPFYSPMETARQAAALLEASTGGWTDINHHYEIVPGSPVPDPNLMWRNARKNLNTAKRAGFSFMELDAADRGHLARVYEVIRLNHLSRNHPLNMTFEQVAEVAPMMHARIFMLTHEGRDAAAAYVHHPAPGIAQVIYHGDAPGFQHLRPMNALVAGVLRSCAAAGMRIVDVGISSVGGRIDPGLCDFKESVGFRPTLRPTVIL